MSDNTREFLVFPVRAKENPNALQNTPNNVCPKCGARILPQNVFCGGCGTRIQGGAQPYQPPQPPPSQPQANAPSGPQLYQQPQTPPLPTVNVQPDSQSYQPPQTPFIGQGGPQSGYQQPNAVGKNKAKKGSAFGKVLLGIAVALFIVWIIMKATQLTEWWEGFIPFVWGEYYDGGLTVLSFISPLMLWGSGYLALIGLNASLPNTKGQ